MVLIAAVGRNKELGKNGELLWHIPGDLKRFKDLTTGHPVIMGRKTWESLPEKVRPLPGRANIVITKQSGYQATGAMVVNSFEKAVEKASETEGSEEIFVIGGGEIYREALPYASKLYLTLVDAHAEADTFFPPYENDFECVKEEDGVGEPPHRFAEFQRK